MDFGTQLSVPRKQRGQRTTTRQTLTSAAGCHMTTIRHRETDETLFTLKVTHNMASTLRIDTESREFFVQLADALGVSQQTRQSYEVGRRRIPVSALPTVATTLAVSLDELFGQSKPAARGKRGPAPQWQQHIEGVVQLPKSQQQFVARMIQTVLAEAATR